MTCARKAGKHFIFQTQARHAIPGLLPGKPAMPQSLGEVRISLHKCKLVSDSSMKPGLGRKHWKIQASVNAVCIQTGRGAKPLEQTAAHKTTLEGSKGGPGQLGLHQHTALPKWCRQSFPSLHQPILHQQGRVLQGHCNSGQSKPKFKCCIQHQFHNRTQFLNLRDSSVYRKHGELVYLGRCDSNE